MAVKPPPTGFFVYTHPSLGWSQYYLDGEKLKSVSKVKEAVGTGDGLQRWAAKEERIMVLDRARVLYGEVFNELRAAVERGASIDALPNDIVFAAKLEAALGRQFSYETIRDTAADIGHEVHAWLEYWFRHRLFMAARGPMPLEPQELSQPAKLAFDAALHFMENEDVVPLAAERPVYSRKIKTGGRLDHIALVRGRACVIDWKVTKRVGYTQKLTTAAYRMLYNDCPEKLAGLERIDTALVIQLPKIEGQTINLFPMDERECDELNETFRHAAVVRDSLDKNGVFDWGRK